MKKFVALVLALVMVLGLCACGGDGDSDKAPGTTPDTPPVADNQASGKEDSTPDAAPSADPGDITSWILEDDPASITGTVRWWMPFKGSQGMDALIAEFNETYPNITVELTTYNNNSDGNMAVNTAIMAGEVDVLASFNLMHAYARWENGLYMDLTDRCEEEGIDLVANWGSDVYKYDGAIYTFPCGGLSNYVAINMTAWNEAGLGDLPTEWTWDEYLDACRKMTKRNADGTVAVYGGSDHHTVNNFTYSLGQVQGSNVYYNNETGESTFDSDEIIHALQREYDAEIVEKIWFPKSVYRADNLQSQQTFVPGTAASILTPNLVRFLADRENYPTDYITGFAPWPVEEKGQTNYMSGVMPFSHAGICVGCKDEEAAWAFLKWYSTYGVKYLVAAGHQPNWRGSDTSAALTLLYGSEEAAAEIVDVESFKRVVGVSSNPSYYEDNLTAYSEINSILTEYVMYALNDTMTPEDAMKEAAALANEAIRNAG